MDTTFSRLLDFLDRLDAARIAYDLKHSRDSLMVVVDVPEGYCEIEFFADSTLEVEWFRRKEGVQEADQDWLDAFLAQQRD